MKRILFTLFLPLGLALPQAGHAAACSNGTSSGHACSHIEFAGHLSAAEMNGSGEVLNDIWGWVDETTGEEYAIVGMQDGTAFVRIGTDGSPEFLGRLVASDGNAPVAKSGGHVHGMKRCHDDLCGEEDSAWRDVKVYDNHAYIVSEAIGHGMQIFDLALLRTLTGDAPDNNLPSAGYYDGIGHAHNVFVNEDSARAYVVGHDRTGVAGGLHVLDLTDPVNPAFLAELNDDGYTHDVQCVVYAGPDPDVATGAELCFASNEDTMTIWDVTDPGNAEVISKTSYDGVSYTHQGWLSPDHRYFYLNDELDEQHTGSRTHLRVLDVRDVDAPSLAADYFAPTLSIDHNNYAYGRWLYQSNYGAGLRILDVSNPRKPVEAAWFDPQLTDNADFYGTWSNYTFPSGYVAFTDIYDGLYVVRPTIEEGGAEPDLVVSLVLDANSAASGEAISGSAAVENTAGVAADDVLVTLHLPSGAQFNTLVEPEGWKCKAANRIVECRGESMAAGTETNFEFTLVSNVGGAIDLIGMAYANAADLSSSDNLDMATLSVSSGSNGGGSDGGGGGGAWFGLLFVVPLLLRLCRRPD